MTTPRTAPRTARKGKRVLLSDEEAALIAQMRAGTNGQATPPDPHGRLDILGIRFIEQLMVGCKDPALHGYYARYKPAIDGLMKEYLGPIQIPSLGKKAPDATR
jgi:hypothetical protein